MKKMFGIPVVVVVAAVGGLGAGLYYWHGSSTAISSNAPAVAQRGDTPPNADERYDQVIAAYTEALRTNPENAEEYRSRGTVYSRHGQYEQALVDYNEALRLNPQDSRAYFNKGLVCRQLGRKPEAIEAYRQFVRYAPAEKVRGIEIEQAKQFIAELGG